MKANPTHNKQLMQSLISIAFAFVLIFILCNAFFSQSVVLLNNAPNYGDIKLEIIENDQIKEQKNFLINPDHLVYPHKIRSTLNQKTLKFYFDRRHAIFATKGILLIGKNFSLDWISAKTIHKSAAVHHVAKSSYSGTTAIFEGFGQAAYFEVKSSSPQFWLNVSGLITVLVISLIVVMIGKLLSVAFIRYDALNQHKFRLLILALLFITFYSINHFIKFITIICIISCAWNMISKLQVRVYKHLISGFFLFVIFSGFATQANLLKTLKDEFGQNETNVKFSFFEELGDRFSRFFNYKKEIGHLNSLMKVDIFGHSPVAKVIIGKQGTMFEGTGERRIEGDNIAFFDNVSDYLGRLPFGDNELAQWETIIRQRQCWLKQQNIPYLFTIAPTKALIYPELLPQVLIDLKSNYNKKSRIELLDDHLRDHKDLNVLNLTKPLIKAKSQQTYPKLFYRTDFHWNYLGAYYAYKAIIEKIPKVTKEFQFTAIELEDFDFDINTQWAHQGFLNMLGLLPQWYNNEHYIKLMPTPGNPIQSIDPYATEGIYDIPIPRKNIVVNSGKEFSVEYIQNPEGEIKKIMVLGDSFIQKVFPLISAHANENYFSRAVFHFPHELIETIKPDIVIQEILNMYLLRQPPSNSNIVAKATCN